MVSGWWHVSSQLKESDEFAIGRERKNIRIYVSQRVSEWMTRYTDSNKVIIGKVFDHVILSLLLPSCSPSLLFPPSLPYPLSSQSSILLDYHFVQSFRVWIFSPSHMDCYHLECTNEQRSSCLFHLHLPLTPIQSCFNYRRLVIHSFHDFLPLASWLAPSVSFDPFYEYM